MTGQFYSKAARVLVALAGLLLARPALAQDVTGQWLTEDADGLVEISRCPAGLCGRLIWFSPAPPPGQIQRDEKNPDPALRSRSLCNLPLMGGFQPDGDTWREGWLYDPDSGKTYTATLRLESADRLRLRGYVGTPLFGETQLWTRQTAPVALCR